MKKNFWLIIIFCLVVGGYLRVIKIDSIPPHLGNDEISIAYDSYSVRMIGKDEHGHSWPLSFESHRTYKAPLYAYLNLPFNYFYGNTEGGVRYLSVVSGLIAIILIAMIGRLIGGETVGIFAAIILTLNPKNISVSRIAFEANLASTMMMFGLYFMMRYRNDINKKWLVLSGFFLGLTIWGYHTHWGMTPLLSVALPWLSRKEIQLKKWWLMWLIMIVTALPIFMNFIGVAIFDPNNRASSQLWLKDVGIENLWRESRINVVKKVVMTAMVPVSNYVEHFGYSINFSSGLLFNDRQPLDSGWHLLITLPLIFVGIVNIKKYAGKWKNWLLGWWLICPIVPALTTGGVSSVRNLSFIIPTIILAAIGFKSVLTRSKLLGLLVGLIVVSNLYFFYLGYYVHFPKYAGDNFQYGYKQAWEYIKPNETKFDHIIVETRFGRFGQYVGVPHLYFGYFGAFSVDEMQNRKDNNGTQIGKFQFRSVDWNSENIQNNSLYVVSVINPLSGKANGKLELLTIIRKPNSEEQFLIYRTN